MERNENTRSLEPGIERDFSDKMSYGSYLALGQLLSAQHPVSRPEHHDEMLFIIQHQTSELWLKLVLHELLAVRTRLQEDDLRSAMKGIARIKHIQRSLTEQWSVLATLTPSEYAQFRGDLGASSGFQSYQYRAVEFLLGNKNEAMIAVFQADPEAQALLSGLLTQTSIYDEFIRCLHRRGYAVDPALLDRDVRKAHVYNESLLEIFKYVYENHEANWDIYEACEELVDLEDNFQLWRFRHLKTVERTIGMKRGTGGSSGAGFLRRALELTFFPELYAVRTEIGR
ncbi:MULTISPECIES: tryptophan 2,3-dioxygenase [unclassified Arthrobacter]|uniref:tryptophan 2,3-dioxygenase n=1 Tax=unclassified Arthrobacter TaxID=235627 RepID=UPI001D1438C7|nr:MULTISPECIES: tryptophan 2,3-dioxygenase family protein [unclassified Arthrobacter]MCC3275160.1 tryptophan 2,3-dioxygenase family protein [Arthrobacter sp. zg-Y20]MCC9176607.1 tryptophan 2,3-dioxygenase family protein [Arthrobacter sp. zg-Y750]MDK1315317.1 tryptophan 2,3-dioxygenase family protein [Arthrobacter sp. zg.Y20]WIB05740.1 tryptophan 2,3-dioxygenase family protein [Arthrobacter sp. zg-Y20]